MLSTQVNFLGKIAHWILVAIVKRLSNAVCHHHCLNNFFLFYKSGHGNVSCYTNTSLFVWVDQIKILYIVSNVYSRSPNGTEGSSIFEFICNGRKGQPLFNKEDLLQGVASFLDLNVLSHPFHYLDILHMGSFVASALVLVVLKLMAAFLWQPK